MLLSTHKTLQIHLDLPSATVHEQFNAGDKTGIVRGQKQSSLRNFIGLAHASHRNGGHNPRNYVRGLSERQRRPDRTRANDVRSDMTIFEVRSPGAHERANCSLACRVNAKGRCAFYTRDRARENNGSAIIQERQTFLHREQCALYIDVEQLVKMLFGDLAKGTKFTNAGVGENNVDSPLNFSDSLVETIQVGQFCDVALNARHVTADCSHGLVEFFLAAASDEDVCALFDEELCCR